MLFEIKKWDVQPIKPHWRDTFVVFPTPITVKVAEIVIWIHHSLVKSASLKEEWIPDPGSLCKITLQSACTLP
jgi:hypothetical protein